MAINELLEESHLGVLYRELEPFNFDYESIPEAIISYQGEIVQIHNEGMWVNTINLHHLGMENYTLKIPYRYAKHPVLEYAVRLALINLIKCYTPIRAYIYTTRIDRLVEVDNHKIGSEEEFLNAVGQVIVTQLITGKDDMSLHSALRYFISNSINEGIWGFDESLAFDLSEIRWRRSSSYLRVTMLDHENGPLVQHEIQSIVEGLHYGNFTVEERVIVRLLLQFGLRPIQLTLLREEDFVFDPIKHEYYLQVPRVKGKRARHRRKKFSTRGPLESELVSDIRELIEINQAVLTPKECGRALFINPIPSERLFTGPFREYAYHRIHGFITSKMNTIERKLNITSKYTGERLHLTAYRFRYTLATTMVLNGYSQEEVAAALDHDNLDSVRYYFRNTHELAEYLDATISKSKDHQVATAKWAGFVDEDYPEGSIIRLQDIAGLGKCLNNQPCHYHPAVSCYGCSQFKPFKYADHQAALSNIEILVESYQASSSGPVKRQLEYALDQALTIVEKQKAVLADE